MFAHRDRMLGRFVLFAAAVVGYGIGCTVNGDAGLQQRSISAGLFTAFLFAAPLVSIGALAIVAMWLARRGWRPFFRRPEHCPECDYPLDRGIAQTCPECGTPSGAADREPQSTDRLWSAATIAGWRSVFLVLLGCAAAQTLALLEEELTPRAAQYAFSIAPGPVETDSSAPDVGHWSPLPGKSCRTWLGWVDWHPTEGRVFRPFRWTPWPAIGTLVYVEQPGPGGRRMFYWYD